jgi:hypothetical protein
MWAATGTGATGMESFLIRKVFSITVALKAEDWFAPDVLTAIKMPEGQIFQRILYAVVKILIDCNKYGWFLQGP